MNKLIAWHGKPELKEEIRKRVLRHQEQDNLIQGKYSEEGKGCAVGCTLNFDDMGEGWHKAYEIQFGIDSRIAALEDSIFEGLPIEQAKEWPLKFVNAIQPGADLSQVADRFLLWLLIDQNHGVIKHATTESAKLAIQAVADAYTRKLNGELITTDTWKKLAKDAATAATAAATAAVYGAADAATAATATAVYGADAVSAARAAREKQAEKLLELLAAAPLTEAT